MASLYTKESAIGKLRKWFLDIFSGETKPTGRHLFELAPDGFRSVHGNFERSISEISDFELKPFYCALNEGKIALSDWMESLTEAALPLALESADALILSVDDTLIEKFGEQFERWGKLYGHAAHNGSHYLNGRRFASPVLSVPLKAAGQYLSFPVACRMWTKEQTKPQMAAELVRSSMAAIGTNRQAILCCDSWHPKGCVKRPVDEYLNLAIICNVGADTAPYAKAGPDLLPLTIYGLRWNIGTAYYEPGAWRMPSPFRNRH